ncbi:MAG: YdcF family protein [Erysipelotrichaceae bacterium]|nr:YdcF family protein [Erysipelotrichaceae bacterium]
MKPKRLLILAAILLVFSSLFIIYAGRTCTVSFQCDDYDGSPVSTEKGEEIISVTAVTYEKGWIHISVKGNKVGKDFVYLEEIGMRSVFVHSFGIITLDTYLGYCRGSAIIPASIAIFLVALLINLRREYRSDMKRSLYQYENILDLSLIIFFSFLLVIQLLSIGSNNNGLLGTVRSILNSAHLFSLITLPLSFVISIMVMISNIVLMKNEGRNWRNMLGIILGALICFLSLLPEILSEILSNTTVIDIHYERGFWNHFDIFLESTAGMGAAYLECVLAATVIIAFKAAKHIPSFDKDYIMILGCMINDDGSLTKLLKSRADRAIEFSQMQKKATGKEITFVPSGGQGPDEVMPEARAIEKYLLEMGVPQERIMAEDRSKNTEENFANSLELIRARKGNDAKVAFSTTNYHVFRSGMIAREAGSDAEGIGSATKRYFWINAFIREFVAIIFEKIRNHVLIFFGLTVFIALLTGIVWICNSL